jgi:hypothetical protein
MAFFVAISAGWWCPRPAWLPCLLYLLEHPFSLCSEQLTFLYPQSSSTGYILSALLLLMLLALTSLSKLTNFSCKDRCRIHCKLTTFNKLADSLSSRALGLATKAALDQSSLLL